MLSSAYAPLKCVKTYLIKILRDIHDGDAGTHRFVELKWFLPDISRKVRRRAFLTEADVVFPNFPPFSL